MISVIIPTLWRSPYVGDLIKYLSAIPEVGEIIIIDNDNPNSIKYADHMAKLRVIENPENNYVNPSWNQGVNAAKYDKLCILNDDVIIPSNVFTLMNTCLSENIGMVGLAHSLFDNIQSNSSDLVENQPICLYKSNRRNFGYGCCIFIHRNSYTHIPDGLRIQYGDDWLFYSSDKQNYVLQGFKIVGKLSASLLDENQKLINEDQVKAICTNDHELFWKLVDEEIIPKEPTSDAHALKLNALKAYRAKSRTNYYF